MTIGAFIFILFLIPHFLSTVQAETIQNDQVIVQFDKSLRKAAEELIRIYPDVKSGLEKTFQYEIIFKPTIALMADREDFQKIIGSDLVVAVAVPKHNLIVIDNSRMKTHPFTLENTVKHELCHLLLNDYVKNGMVPKWLNEGISQWVTGGISEMIVLENKDLLKQAVLSGRVIPLERLTDTFPGDRNALLLAYQASRSVVDYIVAEFGQAGLIQVLAQLNAGNNIDGAVYEGLAVSVQELESSWHAYLRKKYTWFTYLSSHIYQILFVFGGVAALYGFIRLYIQRKTYKDEEDYIDD